ncbi:PREDICTED: protein SIEVE ELEMENT OCCLUSION B-like [Nelumbo nucifera]|uniref:Protein SIEVE ELEMENT OCCLUSION B-like n=1 Tax=Nelumbo nucifera TaxID=4432 RepID=A0A1U7Z605_NELNU|nr:PREDICTED: protein SIEVE ELEMENT OCCLUSION B-like [Nelumbo nucifera]
MRGDRNIMFSTSDDSAMMKQILATHAHDGREIDVKPLIQLIGDIFQTSPPTAPTAVDGVIVPAAETHPIDALVDKTQHLGFVGVMEAVAYTIHKISTEISYKCSGGADAHATTQSVFNMVSSYTWEAKMVLALAAFAVTYGEFSLVSRFYLTDQLAKSIALLKQLPDILEHSELLKPRFDALRKLFMSLLDLTKCVIEFRGLPTQYISSDTPPMSVAVNLIPTAAYWTVRSVVACSTQIISLIGFGYEYVPSTAEAWELSSLAHKISNILDLLKKQLHLCYQHIDEKRHLEAFQTLIRLFETPHIDNTKILKALIYAKDDLQLLFDGTRVGLDVLRRKNVLLLISDLDISRDELSILEQVYMESRQQPTRPESQFEVVWIPVVDRSLPWDQYKQTDFERLQTSMPWYSVHHPSLIDPAVIRYIKEIWNFGKKPILVVLDPQGKVVCQNAIHMLWIWGSMAFPFTSNKEESLWKEQTWKLDFLVDGIDQQILNWIVEERYICLYGGDNLEWMEAFVNALRAVALEDNISIEFMYVGKSKPKEPQAKINGVIMSKKLGHFLSERALIWFFWDRLQRMYYSKMKQPRKNAGEHDHIMQEVMTMLSFDSSDQEWAVISRGSFEMARAKGDQILKSIRMHEEWKEQVGSKGFIPALNDHLHGHPPEHHCNRLILPGTVANIPETVPCSECNRPMEKYVLYRCCTD